MGSVMQEWTHELSLREQGTIIVALRGCDLTPKQPYDAPERQLVAYLRWLVMVPADEREIGFVGGFMQDHVDPRWKQSDLGHLPLHWVSHLMHAYEVVGYRHPNINLRREAFAIYEKIVYGLHLKVEPLGVMDFRLTEDRIASGTVVS